MDNPWLLLPAAQPFVVQADAAVVAAFNRKYAGTPYALHTELPPEPFQAVWMRLSSFWISILATVETMRPSCLGMKNFR